MGTLIGKALPHQYKFLTSKAKYPALVSGLGAGKTEALVYRVLKFLTEIPKARIAIYEPTVDLIKQILHPRFEDIFANSGILYKLNKSENTLQVWMPQGKCELIFRSMDNYTRIIGFEVHHSILDEIDTIPKTKAMEVWVRVLARNRKKFINQDGSRGINTVGITTTPEGKAFVYDMWMKEHADNPEYELIRGRTVDNHHLPADYVDSLRKTYPPQLIEAYLEGQFVNLVGNTVYDSYDRDKNDTNAVLKDYPESQMVHIGVDFNVGRMAAAIIMKNDDKQAFMVAEIHHVMDTPAMIEVIRAKIGNNRPITIYPDASGRSRKSVDASKSDIRLLRDAGFRINAPKKNPPVRERVVSVNAMFCNAEGDRNLFVNQRKCPHMVEQLEFQAYDTNSVPIKDGDEDCLDALGYCINRIHGLAKPTTTIARMRMGI